MDSGIIAHPVPNAKITEILLQGLCGGIKLSIKIILAQGKFVVYITQAITCILNMRRDLFQAIADPTRRRILVSLTNETQNVNALADQFDMTRQAVSLHVKYLQECGVIIIEKKGRQRLCKLNIQEMVKIYDWLDPFRKLWESRFENLDNLLDTLKTKSTKGQ